MIVNSSGLLLKFDFVSLNFSLDQETDVEFLRQKGKGLARHLFASSAKINVESN